MDKLKTNVLYYGDNLEILRKYIPDNSIDLTYLDPPFSSKKDYNIIFKEPTGELSAAQIKAFSDTWHWDKAAEDTFQDIILNAPPKVAKLIDAIVSGLGRNDVTAYLVMMTIRLVELHRVLKDTGSIYLHCDPTASHYLKMVLDQVFGVKNFRNEITWCYGVGGRSQKHFGRKHDVLLFYTKQEIYQFNVDAVRVPRKPGTHMKVGVDNERREFQEKTDTKTGKVYRYYVDQGKIPEDYWVDIPSLNWEERERLGYPTQKPLALLERIVKASSNEGDVVLDPFCGCGTALVEAQKLNRKWIGIDITHLAIAVMKSRLEESFPGIQFEVIGEPEDLASAKALARQDRYQFQWWALSLIKAKPFPEERRKGADKGIDGVIDFQDRDEITGKPAMRRAVVSVKSGHVHVKDIRELKDIASRHAMGVFITLEPPTKEMCTEAVSASSYHSTLWSKDYPKIQILTIEELLRGKLIDMPPASSPYAKAPKVSKKEGALLSMGGQKFNAGDRVIGNDKKASFRERPGAVIGYHRPTNEYLVHFDDGREEYVNPGWIDPEKSVS
jgi:site-specific DNA-methyltransferase (adenine-specific)